MWNGVQYWSLSIVLSHFLIPQHLFAYLWRGIRHLELVLKSVLLLPSLMLKWIRRGLTLRYVPPTEYRKYKAQFVKMYIYWTDWSCQKQSLIKYSIVKQIKDQMICFLMYMIYKGMKSLRYIEGEQAWLPTFIVHTWPKEQSL